MNYTALKNILSGVYMIDPLQISNYEFMLDALRNGFAFDTPKERDEFKSYLLDSIKGATATANGGDPQATKIAVHSQRDIMLRDDMGCGHVGTRTIGNRLRQNDADDEVMAQIIIFDTPGGASNSPIEIADAIAECEKPVYAWVDGMCCSAGVYASSYCTEIFAHRKDDMIGSIGAYAEYAGYKNGDKDNQGRTHYRIYGTNSENKNKEYEELIQNGNYEFVKKKVDKHRDQFVKDVLANRPNATEADHCHGDTWDASEVVGSLIDGIKTWSEMIDHIVSEHQKKSSGSSSSTSQSKINKIKSMKDLVVLAGVLAAAGIKDVELDADGALTLNGEQLSDLNAALENYKDAEAVQAIETERDNAKAAQTKAENDLSEAKDTIASKDQEISGLKDGTIAKPAAANKDITATDTLTAMQDAEKLVEELSQD